MEGKGKQGKLVLRVDMYCCTTAINIESRRCDGVGGAAESGTDVRRC